MKTLYLSKEGKIVYGGVEEYEASMKVLHLNDFKKISQRSHRVTISNKTGGVTFSLRSKADGEELYSRLMNFYITGEFDWTDVEEKIANTTLLPTGSIQITKLVIVEF